MPLFPYVMGDYQLRGKSHTNLIVSEGNAPAENFIVSKQEGFKFTYQFGPRGNQNVVLAKGKILDLGAPEFDYETERNITTVKTAATGSKNVVGINHHNLYERLRDRFSGNKPTVVTRSYIEVPLFEHTDVAVAQGYADAMQYGAAYGVSNDIKPGDYVKAGANGNFTKHVVGTDDPLAIVGQAYAAERELPPMGFLQYYLDLDIKELDDFFRNMSHAPSPGTNGGLPQPNGQGPDVGAYPLGYPWGLHKWKADMDKLMNPIINKGIPFLTDGYFKSKQTVTNIPLNDIYDAATNNDGHIENVVFSGGVTFGTVAGAPAVFTASTGNAIAPSVKVDANTRNNALFIKLRHPIDRAEVDKVAVHYTDDAGATKTIDPRDIHVDLQWSLTDIMQNNMVVVYLEAGVTYRDIQIDAKLTVDPVAGVPTEWDYAGSVGAVRILLKG